MNKFSFAPGNYLNIEKLPGYLFGENHRPNTKTIILIMMLMVSFILSHGNLKVGEFTYTHYLFSYENGFIKRGLIGEIMRQADIYPTRAWVLKCSIVNFLAVLVAMVIIIARPVLRNPQNTGLWIFALTALGHNATLQHHFRDLGRFDAHGLILAIFSVLLIERLQGKTIVLALLLFAISALGVLIHEAYFIINLPLVIAYFCFMHRNYNGWVTAIILSVITGILTFTVSTKGLLPDKDVTAYTAQLEQEYGKIFRQGVKVLGRNLGDNVALSMDKFVDTDQPKFNAVRLLIILLPVCLVFRPLFHIFRQNKYPMLLVMAGFSPLLMYPLGFDYMRWWALAICNVFVAMALFGWHNSEQFGTVIYQQKIMAILVLFVSVWFGPMKVNSIGW